MHEDLGRKPRNIRSQNRQLIIDLYRQHDELSISDITRMVGLSRTTVMNINHDLLIERIIADAGKGESTVEGGKKPKIFKFHSGKQIILTFYIRHDAVLCTLYDLAFQPLAEDRLPIGRNSRFQDIVRKMQTIIRRSVQKHPAYAESPLLACMIGVHGNMDLSTGICRQSTYFSSWGTDSNLGAILIERLGLDCPVYVDHWIRLKTYGENRMGLVGQHDSVVLIDAGWHGVVAGILLNGELYTGKHFLSGEIGHFRISPDDRETCFCGSCGCFEQQVSLKRLYRRAQDLLAEFPASLLAADRDQLDLVRIFRAADRDDELARQLLDEVIHWFSLMVSYLILFFDPEVLFIEGDYAAGCSYFEQGIMHRIRALTLPRLKRESVLQFHASGSDAVMKGAAILAFDKYYLAGKISGERQESSGDGPKDDLKPQPGLLT